MLTAFLVTLFTWWIIPKPWRRKRKAKRKRDVWDDMIWYDIWFGDD